MFVERDDDENEGQGAATVDGERLLESDDGDGVLEDPPTPPPD
jgi:hypothetical protein